MFEILLSDRLETIADNVYPITAPQGYASPCVVYQCLQTEAIEDLDGTSDEGFITAQISISSTSLIEAKTLAREVRNSLRDWYEDGVQTISWIDEQTGVDNSTDVTLYRVLLFFRFFCTE